MSSTTATASQVTNPSVAEGLATLSGSSNEFTYNLVIQNDGSATGGKSFKTHALVIRLDFPAGTFDTKKLESLLTDVGDVSQIPIVSTQISYAGKSSGNLSSIPHQESSGDPLLQAANHLAKYVLATLNELKII